MIIAMELAGSLVQACQKSLAADPDRPGVINSQRERLALPSSLRHCSVDPDCPGECIRSAIQIERVAIRQAVDVIKRCLASTYRDDELWAAIQKLEDLADKMNKPKEEHSDHP